VRVTAAINSGVKTVRSKRGRLKHACHNAMGSAVDMPCAPCCEKAAGGNKDTPSSRRRSPPCARCSPRRSRFDQRGAAVLARSRSARMADRFHQKDAFASRSDDGRRAPALSNKTRRAGRFSEDVVGDPCTKIEHHEEAVAIVARLNKARGAHGLGLHRPRPYRDPNGMPNLAACRIACNCRSKSASSRRHRREEIPTGMVEEAAKRVT